MHELSIVAQPTNVLISDASQDELVISVEPIALILTTSEPPCEIDLSITNHPLVLESVVSELIFQTSDQVLEIGQLCPVGGGEENAGQNVGGGAELYRGKTGVLLDFRTVVAGPGVAVQTIGDTVEVSSLSVETCLANCLATDEIGACIYFTGPQVAGRHQVTTIDPFIDPPQIFKGVILSKETATECTVQIGGFYATPYAVPFAQVYYVAADGRISSAPPPAISGIVAWQAVAVPVDTNMVRLRVGWYLDQRRGEWVNAIVT